MCCGGSEFGMLGVAVAATIFKDRGDKHKT
jgi:hypothetical protein